MKRILILLTLLSGIAFGQVATRFDGVAQTTRSINGNTLLVPSPNASVTVCTYPATGGLPCTNKASVCPDSTGVGCTAGSPNNPITADAQGNFGFWALPGTYQYSVCPVSGVCRGPYNASVPNTGTGAFSGTFTGNVTGNVTGQSGSTLVDAVQDKGFVNAVSDCGVATDFVTDICTTLNACIAANKGKRIGLPKLRANPSTLQDYTSSCRTDMNGDGTTLFAMGGTGRWGYGAVIIQNPSGVQGLRIDTDCNGCHVKDIYFSGGDPFNGNNLSTFEDFKAETDFQGTAGIDGIQILAESPTLENVTAYGYKRHCFLVNGNSVGQPDLGRYVGLVPNACRAYGIYTYGTDANVSTFTNVNCWFNALGCTKESAFYGNAWIAPHSTGNAQFPAVAAGSNKTISAAPTGLVVASNILTISSTAHGWVTNQWITTTGATDTTFNGTCKLTAVTANTATCPFTHADGNTGGGTGATSASTDISAYYTAKGIKYGSYVTTSTAGCANFFGAYSESTSGTPVWGCALDLGGQGVNNYTTGGHISMDTSSNMFIKSNGLVFTPNTGSGKFFLLTETTGATNKVAMDPNTGDMQITGKIRIRPTMSIFTAFTGGLELPNGSTWALMFKKVGGASSFGAYLDGADKLNLGDVEGTIINTTIPLQITATKTGTASNTDLAGQLTMAAGTIAYTFAKTWATAPICVASDITAINAVRVQTTTTTLTVTGTGTDLVNYICVGRT